MKIEKRLTRFTKFRYCTIWMRVCKSLLAMSNT